MHTKLLFTICILLALCACEFPVIETIGCDVTELIDAINDANATPTTGDNIALAADCIYELTAVDNSDTLGNNGLPVITSPIAIIGNGASIQRASAAGTPQFRLFKVAQTGELLVSDITLANGAASPADDTGIIIGGAISNQGELTVASSTFLNNQADLGGAIRNFLGTVTITSSTFTDNVANQSGGAVYNQGGDLTVSNSQFSDNIASTGRGGAINNSHQDTGTMATIMGSTFTGNVAFTGGAIGNRQNGHMDVDDSSFFNNQASRGGAFINYAALDIRGSTIANNTANSGGGIQNIGDLWLVNCTLSGNSLTSAPGPENQGSAIIHDVGRLMISFTTITGNSGSGDRPAVDINSGFGVAFNNLIIAMNTGGDCDFSAPSTAFNITGNNLDSDSSCTGFSLTGNPFLGPLADNGGPTQTHALLTGSPAIDGSAPYDSLPIDQRGVFRPQGAECDLGAYELEVLTPVVEISPVVTLQPLQPLLPTATPTEGPPSFHLDTNGFCRLGPDTRYQDVTAFTAGTVLNVDGRNEDNTWWWIGEFNCWISDSVGQFHGDAESLSVIIPPELPEPEPELTCSADLNEELCIEAGGTWVESVNRSPYCACPDED